MPRLTRLQLFALQLWTCGLRTPQLAIAMGWTAAETQTFQRQHQAHRAQLLEQWAAETTVACGAQTTKPSSPAAPTTRVATSAPA